jgi:hypothetical protein
MAMPTAVLTAMLAPVPTSVFLRRRLQLYVVSDSLTDAGDGAFAFIGSYVGADGRSGACAESLLASLTSPTPTSVLTAVRVGDCTGVLTYACA